MGAVNESTAADVPGAAPQSGVWVERTGPGTFRGVSASGARVLIGAANTGPVFTPGELLQIALAACSASSADARLSLALGPNFQSITRAVPTKDTENNRYSSFAETMQIDLSALDSETKARTVKLALSSIDNHCTVGNTVTTGAAVPELEFIEP